MVSELQYEVNQYKNIYFFDLETKWMNWENCEEDEESKIVMDLKEEFQRIIENIVFNGHNMHECMDENCYGCIENLQDLKVYVPAYEALFNFITNEISLKDLCILLTNSKLSYSTTCG